MKSAQKRAVGRFQQRENLEGKHKIERERPTPLRYYVFTRLSFDLEKLANLVKDGSLIFIKIGG